MKVALYCPASLKVRQLNQSRVQIAFVIPTLDQSGAERQLTLLATNLPTEQYDIRVIALNRAGFYAEKLRQHGITVEVLNKRFRFDPFTYVRLRSLLRSWKPNIVHSYLFAANTYARLPGITPSESSIIVSERCVDTWKASWQVQLDRWLRSRMSRMTVNSESVREFYQNQIEVDSDDLVLIPNAVVIEQYEQESANDGEAVSLRTELGLTAEHRLIGYAGRLAPQKCLEDLVWAFQMLHQCVDFPVALILIGQGEERQKLADLATSMGCRDKVFFAGHREDASSLISQLDVFCLASSFEGMSNSLMEAMLQGVPVVVSDIKANRELVTHEEMGLVYPLGDCPEMTRAIKRLLDDSQFAQTLSSRATELMRQEYSLDKLVQRHCDLYQELVAVNSGQF